MIDYKNLVKSMVTEKRYRHSIEVSKRAVELAKIHNGDIKNAETAGILHDCCKCMTNDKMLEMFKKSNVIMDIVFEKSTTLWHSLAAYFYCKDELKIDDTDILNAVKYHTSGRAGMSKLEKIIYLADLTSNDRNYPELQTVIKLSNDSLDNAMLYSLRFSIVDLIERKLPISIDTIKAYNHHIINSL